MLPKWRRSLPCDVAMYKPHRIASMFLSYEPISCCQVQTWVISLSLVHPVWSALCDMFPDRMPCCCNRVVTYLEVLESPSNHSPHPHQARYWGRRHLLSPLWFLDPLEFQICPHLTEHNGLVREVHILWVFFSVSFRGGHYLPKSCLTQGHIEGGLLRLSLENVTLPLAYSTYSSKRKWCPIRAAYSCYISTQIKHEWR